MGNDKTKREQLHDYWWRQYVSKKSKWWQLIWSLTALKITIIVAFCLNCFWFVCPQFSTARPHDGRHIMPSKLPDPFFFANIYVWATWTLSKIIWPNTSHCVRMKFAGSEIVKWSVGLSSLSSIFFPDHMRFQKPFASVIFFSKGRLRVVFVIPVNGGNTFKSFIWPFFTFNIYFYILNAASRGIRKQLMSRWSHAMTGVKHLEFNQFSMSSG